MATIKLLLQLKLRYKRPYFLVGEIGKVQVIKASSRDSPLGPISYLKVSGGVFKDALVHDFDLLTWIVGELPTEVFVNGSNSFAEVCEETFNQQTN